MNCFPLLDDTTAVSHCLFCVMYCNCFVCFFFYLVYIPHRVCHLPIYLLHLMSRRVLLSVIDVKQTVDEHVRHLLYVTLCIYWFVVMVVAYLFVFVHLFVVDIYIVAYSVRHIRSN